MWYTEYTAADYNYDHEYEYECEYEHKYEHEQIIRR
jgi:hypothetical protein